MRRGRIGSFTTDGTYDVATDTFTVRGGKSCPQGGYGYSAELTVTSAQCGNSSTVSVTRTGFVYAITMGISQPCAPPPPSAGAAPGGTLSPAAWSPPSNNAVPLGVGIGLGLGLPIVGLIIFVLMKLGFSAKIAGAAGAKAVAVSAA